MIYGEDDEFKLDKCKYITRFEKSDNGLYQKYRYVEYCSLDEEDKDYLINLVGFDIIKDTCINKPDSDNENGKPTYTPYWELKTRNSDNCAHAEPTQFSIGDYDGILNSLDKYFKEANIIFTYNQ